ncbi:hypothetical protein V6N11_017455 [Hibiscus sabdariffa]|uniref:Uncharacterized protein n=1 Tax=Hibiscus sabdariffa TaxID=183260 RepID=A0ABR2TYF2_9ROSI
MGETVNIKGALSARLSWGVPRCCEGVHGCCGISSKVEVLKAFWGFLNQTCKGLCDSSWSLIVVVSAVGDFVIGGD